MTVDDQVILINTTDSSNKFWMCITSNSSSNLETRWGRLGTKGQSKIEECGSPLAAKDIAYFKSEEKLDKGYKRVTTRQYELAAMRGEVVGAAMKIEYVRFLSRVVDDTYKSIPDSDLEITLANPSYVPVIIVKIVLTAGKGEYTILADSSESYVITSSNGNSNVLNVKSKCRILEHPEYKPVTGNQLNKIEKSINNIISTLFK